MDLIFFRLSKLIWMVICPDSLLVILILIGVVLLMAGAVKKAKILFSIVALFILAICFLPLGTILLAPLENRFSSPPKLPVHVDGVICLGGAEKAYLSSFTGQAELGNAAERYLGFIRLMRRYPHAIHLFSGGSGSLAHQAFRDADVARVVFADLGLDTSSIIFESRSRNTYENGKVSKSIVNPTPDQNWILVTSAGHMPRAVGVFRKLGWQVIAYPVDHVGSPKIPLTFALDFSGHLNQLKWTLREWTGLAAYYLTGKTSEWIPGPAPEEG
jgi:uncharacterized SAM-binding protein YcdF (DUF218 family)